MNQTEKKLRNAGLYPSKFVTVENTRSVVIECAGEYDEVEGWKNAVINCLSTDKHPWGGFRAAGGHWYIEKDYNSAPFEAALRDQLGVAYYG